MVRHKPGTGGSLVVRPDDDPPHRDLVAVLPLLAVTPEPDLHLPAVHHDPVVVPGDAMSGSQHEPVSNESSSTGSPSDASPGPSECGLNKGKFLA